MKKLILVSLLSLLFIPLLASASITTNLYYGVQNKPQVQELQEFLISQGFLSGNTTGNFYSLTLKAVKAYQTSVDISPTGYVGVLTRKSVNDTLTTELSASNQESLNETGSTPATSSQQSNVTNSPPTGCTSNFGYSSLTGKPCSSSSIPAIQNPATPTIVCPQYATSVCGSDGKTYVGNPCLGYGMPSNVTIASQGACTTSTTTCTPNWQCGAWSNCANSQQTRTCTDSGNCNNNNGEPSLTEYCSIPTSNLNPPPTTPAQTDLVVTKYSGYNNQTLNSNQTKAQIGSFMIFNNSQQTIVVNSLTVGLNFGSYISSSETSQIQNYSNLRVSFADSPTFKVACGSASCPELINQGPNSFTTSTGSIDLTIPPNQSYGLNVFVDSGADSNPSATIQTALSVGYTDPITGNSVTTSPVMGQTITFFGTTPPPPAYTGGLAVSENTAYADQTINPNTAQAKIGSFILQNQSTTEPVKVTSLYVGLIADMPNFSKMDVFTDSGVEIGSPSNSINTITNTFTPNNLTLAPGQSETINVLINSAFRSNEITKTSLEVNAIGTLTNVSSGTNGATGPVQGQTITFNYNPANTPSSTITNITPTGDQTPGGATVTITGTGFQSRAWVSIGGNSAANINVVNSTEITASVPAGSPGWADVTVTEPDGSSVTSPGGFTYQ